MSLPSLLTHRASFTRRSYRTSDAGDTVTAGTWAPTTLTGVPCRAAQIAGDIDAIPQRERTRSQWTIVLTPTNDVRTRDRAVITLDDGSTVTLEVREVRRLTTPGRTHHLRLDAEEVTG